MTDWIIAIANSAIDGVVIKRFRGTRDEVKGVLLELVNNDRKNDVTKFEYGTESMDEIEEFEMEINAYGSYLDYHIDYTAMELYDIDFI